MEMQKLKSVFGALAQTKAGPPKTTNKLPYVDSALVPEVLPPTPQIHEKTGIVLLPSKRIDGSITDAPWSVSESTAWNWLRTATIEHVEEKVLNGTGGSLWARCRNDQGESRSVLLRFDTIGFDGVYETWGQEYDLDPERHDVIRREQASYEAAKSLGCEDIVPPFAARQVNLVPLVSDAFREVIAAKYGIAPLLVDESYGVIGALQLTPLNACNFVEHWATLGPDFKNQFEMASDALRYGMYRLIALDFILGTGNRLLSDLLHNEATDSVAIYGFGVTFPDPVAITDKYLAQRALGWGRRMTGPTEDAAPGSPACGDDAMWLPDYFGDKERAECLRTFSQMSKSFDHNTVVLTCQIFEELGVPRLNIAGYVSRMIYLQEDPDSVLDDWFDYIRSVLVPMRRGYGFDQGRNSKIVETTNQIFTAAFGEVFDFASVMQSVV